jgi:hypothetical protein
MKKENPLHLYIKDKKIYAILLYIKCQFPDIFHKIMDSIKYSTSSSEEEIKKFIYQYFNNINTIFDLEIFAQQSNDENLKEHIRNVIENPIPYLEKYLSIEDLIDIKTQFLVISIDKLMNKIPKGMASASYAQIIDTVVNFFKELKKEKITKIEGLLEQTFTEEEEDDNDNG